MKKLTAFCIYTCLLSSLSVQLVNAQAIHPLLSNNPLKSHLDSAVQKGAALYMKNAGTVGLMIGVCKGGRNYIYSYGESVKGTGSLPEANQLFNLGSVAKTFVGTMLAEAVVEKRVKLTDDIRLYLPGEYPNLQYEGHAVRLIDLANHTSGMPNAARDFPVSLMDSVKKLALPGQLNFFLGYNQDTLLKDLHHFKIDTIPGTKYHYNGNAMEVLILLLEQIYKQPYEMLVTNYLKTHLNMHDTRTRIPVKQLGRFIQGYNGDGVAVKWYDLKINKDTDINTNLFYPGGPSMNSTVNDMMKYLRAQIAENDPAIKLTHQLTWGNNPKDFAIGLNWMFDLEDGIRDYYHSGHTGIGFNTLGEFYPTEGVGLMIVVNENISQDKVSQLENDIHKAMK
jgi:CubicO group peptidase (beta-lactamase class C family)